MAQENGAKYRKAACLRDKILKINPQIKKFCELIADL